MIEKLTAPGGEEFHVSCGVSDYYLISRAWKPGTLVTTLRPIPQGVTMLEIEPPAALDRMRLYPGQRDPNDPSSFIVRYNIDGRDGHVIGKMGDDGVIHFTGTDVRTSSTTAPASPSSAMMRTCGRITSSPGVSFATASPNQRTVPSEASTN